MVELSQNDSSPVSAQPQETKTDVHTDAHAKARTEATDTTSMVVVMHDSRASGGGSRPGSGSEGRARCCCGR